MSNCANKKCTAYSNESGSLYNILILVIVILKQKIILVDVLSRLLHWLTPSNSVLISESASECDMHLNSKADKSAA